MKVIATDIPDVLILEPKKYTDDRGQFLESYNKKKYRDILGDSVTFVQDNHSSSRKNVLRGLHYQIKRPQGKLVRVVFGEVFDVAVDLRKYSPTFGKWAGVYLSEENRHQLWVPPGFAHGFLVTSDRAEFLYKTTDYYAPEYERCIRWDDQTLDIKWPSAGSPNLSKKDAAGDTFQEADCFD